MCALALTAAILVPNAAQADRSQDWEECDSFGNQDVARAACTRLIESGRETQEDLARAYYLRAINREQTACENSDDAINDLTEALFLKPNYAQAYVARGHMYRCKGEYERAIADHDRALRIDPKSATAYWERAIALSQWGKDDLAIQDYNQAIRLSPNDEIYYYGRGTAYLAMGEYDKAIEDFTQANSLNHTPSWNKDYPAALASRGWAYFKKQNFDQALADARHAAELAPNEPWILENLAKIEDGRRAWLARAQSQPTGRRIALVIGNGVYRSTTPLPNAIHDAEDVARELKNLGFEIFGFPATNFSKRALADALDQFARASVGATSAIVWYSGHGQQSSYADDERSLYDWVIPVDAVIKRRADVANNALRVDTLINAVLAAKQVRLVVIDACRNNTFWNETRGVSRKSVERASVLIVYSAQPGNVAIDDIGGRNSPFAQAFIESLRADPKRDVQKLFDAVAGRTAQLTKGEQRPQPIGGMGTGEITPLAP